MSGREHEADAEGAAEMDALIGHTVGGRFLITGRIARGGMACVYAAKQAQLNRSVAIKVLRSSIVGSEASAEFRRRFLQEASILSRLQHPNLVTLLDYGQITELPGDHYFIAMEYLDGETLARRFRTKGRLSVAHSIRMARQVGRGLREAHRQGFVHRDLKPSNIMLVPEDDESDIVKLIDFGIGKAVEPSARELVAEDEEEMTRVGLLLGSPRYMAPEQIRGEAVEPRTDLYGLGIILFQALTGRLPFEHKSDVETMLAHCNTTPPPVDAYVEDATGSLSELVADLLQKRAADRPTVHEFLARLATAEGELFDSLGLAGPTLSSTRPSTAPRSTRDSIRPPPPPPRRSLSLSFDAEPPSLRELGEQVRGRSEPPTVVTTGNFASSMPSSAPPSGTLPAIDLYSSSFVTVPPSQNALMSAPASELRPARSTAKALGALLLLGALGSALWLGLRSKPQPSLASAPLPTLPSAALRTAFLLRLDSVPGQAVVKEGATVLGVTPLQLEIQRESLAAGPRRFVIEKGGFAPFTYEQADSVSDSETTAQLVAEVAPRAAAKRSRKRDVVTSAATPVEKPAAPLPRIAERLDINLAR